MKKESELKSRQDKIEPITPSLKLKVLIAVVCSWIVAVAVVVSIPYLLQNQNLVANDKELSSIKRLSDDREFIRFNIQSRQDVNFDRCAEYRVPKIASLAFAGVLTALLSQDLTIRRIITFLILLLVIIVFAWNWSKRQAVVRQTKELRIKLIEQEQVEKALSHARQEWERIFQAIGHPTIILNPQQEIIAINQATMRATNQSEKELLGKRCYEVFHSPNTNHPPPRCPFINMQKSGHLESFEMEIEALDGTFLVSCTPIVDDAGKLEKVIHIATDITEKKRAHDALRESEKKYRELYENIRDGSAAVDMSGKIIECNTEFLNMVGYSFEELTQKSYNDLTVAK